MNNHTWKLVDIPHISKLLGHKCIFKRKIKTYETIDKYKVILVVKGLRQQEDVDYFDIFIYVKNNFHMNIYSHRSY
jgi:hypothetical protein